MTVQEQSMECDARKRARKLKAQGHKVLLRKDEFWSGWLLVDLTAGETEWFICGMKI